MRKEIAHDLLINDVSAVKTTAQHTDFVALLHERKYNEALLLGCKQCVVEDKVQYQLLSILAKYAAVLSIDFNVEESIETTNEMQQEESIPVSTGRTPGYYAVKNKNPELYFLLTSSGAKLSESLESEWLLLNILAMSKIHHNLPKEYTQNTASIANEYSKLPLKHMQATDPINATYDNQRLICLLRIMSHIMKYHRTLNDISYITGTLDLFEQDVFYNFRIIEVRKYLEKISDIIANLSGSFRSQHADLLKPLSWITLEQLGGVLKVSSGVKFNITTLGNIALGDLLATDNYHKDIISGTTFAREYSAHDLLVEETIPDLIKELPVIEQFFRTLYTAQLRPATILTPVVLPTVRAVTRYFKETQLLVELLNQLGRITFPKVTAPSQPIQELSLKFHIDFQGAGAKAAQKEYLSTKMGRHALLRLLQNLGEIFTGKNTDFSQLDETIDFNSLIALRDCISHQDENHNKFYIDALLQDEKKLTQIVEVELPELLKKVERFISARQKRYGDYTGNSKEYWSNVLTVQKTSFAPQQAASSSSSLALRRLQPAREEELMRALEKALAQDCIKLSETREVVLARFEVLLDGNSPVPPTRATIGKAMQPFGALKKHEDGTLFNTLSTIMAETLPLKTKTTVDERNDLRTKIDQEATKRRTEKENRLRGIETIRSLVAQLQQTPEKQHCITPIKRVDAAIDALMNIRTFLEKSGYLNNALPYQDMTAWDEHHKKQGQPNLVSLLLSDPILNDAIEYNAGQLLQLLDTLRTYSEAQFSILLQNEYEELRSLRNYIEHGHPLIVSYSDALNMDSPHAGKRQTIIASKLISLIYKLAPDLQKIKGEMELKAVQLATPKPLIELPTVKSNVTRDTPLVRAPGVRLPPLVTHGVFNAIPVRNLSEERIEHTEKNDLVI